MENYPHNAVGTNIEQLALQLGRALVHLDETEQRLKHTTVLMPGETKFRDPFDTYDHITLGAVLANHSLSALYARRLDALLSMNFVQLGELAEGLLIQEPEVQEDDQETLGMALVKILDRGAGLLERLGQYQEWRRAFEKYKSRTEEFLATLTHEELEKLYSKPVSKGQVNLIRYTCACHQLEFPALANRGAAFKWLRDVGANPRYREVAL